MKNRTLFFTLSAIGLAASAFSLSGCGYLKARQARAAYGQYQQAVAAGDMGSARIALIKLVRAEEDVPDYWVELGKLQLQMGAYSEAYDAFTHAHELDRSNAEALATMAQIALLSGQVDLANEHAKTLALISPGSPVVTMVRAYGDFKAGELDKALAGADSILSTTPNDPFATILKYRVFLARGQINDAIALLENQHRAVPQDVSAIRSLVDIYHARDDWRDAARIQYDYYRLDRKNTKAALGAVEAFLRSGNPSAARKMSEPLLSPAANPLSLDAVLALWATDAPRGVVLPGGMQLAQAASGDRRAAFANYYNRIGNPAAAASLLGTSQLPVTHVNARWNAVYAQTLALQGRSEEAQRLFDLVLQKEPDQVDALRGRSALEAKTGRFRQAIIDAQRLVTISPTSGEDRVLLAQAYRAAGRREDVRRALWQAFQDLPDDERVVAALKSVLASIGDRDGERRVDDEFMDRRMAGLTKDLV